jgi:hypothetical protein
MEASMTLPNPHNQPIDDRNDQVDESLQYPPEDQTQFAPDAPPLRADEYDRPDAYDPVWTGQGKVGPSEAVAQTDLERIEQILSSEHFRIRRKRAADFVPPPPQPVAQKRPGIRWAIGTFVLLVGTSAFIAYQASEPTRLLDGTADTGGVFDRVASRFAAPPQERSDTPQASPATPAPAVKAHLVVNGASADSPDQILLGVAAEGAADGMSAVVGGLVPGTTLTSGKPWGSTGWILPAGELATAYLRPPSNFSGVMEYSVTLQRPDNSVVDRQTMRLEWAAPAAPAAASSPNAPVEPSALQQPAPPPPPASRTDARNLTPDEVAAMLKRCDALLIEGDIASARLLLQRAADAQDARAAFALAASYDPIEMKRLGVYGAAPDVTKARDWYERARQYGSREAPKRLELLASQFR